MNEIWKPVKGFEGLYEVSNIGRVKSFVGRWGIKERILKPWLTSNGYWHVCLGRGNKKMIHKLVLEAFAPNPKGKPCCNHKNGIRTDNRIENLEWCTYAENNRHAIDVLGKCLGEKNPHAKLNAKQVRVIKHLKNIKPKMSSPEVAKYFPIERRVVIDIWNNKTWKHITI